MNGFLKMETRSIPVFLIILLNDHIFHLPEHLNLYFHELACGHFCFL